MNRPKVNAAERIGVENVEKNSAIAVISISSTRINPTASTSAGSSAGASHARCTSALTPQAMDNSTAYRAAAITATFTSKVSVRPAYLPSTSW